MSYSTFQFALRKAIYYWDPSNFLDQHNAERACASDTMGMNQKYIHLNTYEYRAFYDRFSSPLDLHLPMLVLLACINCY